ncbi:MAG: MBL fold metallo-hydrolase [Candidatus Bathyarchaeia archaeon]
MSFTGLALREADHVEIISLMDNSVDLLSSSPRVEVKGFREWARRGNQFPIAEHGFSMLIRIFDGSTPHSILFDAGISPRGLLVNARRLGLSLTDVECIVLSHGHYDHFGGLTAAAGSINREGLPIFVHDVFNIRGAINPEGRVRRYPPFPAEEKVKPARYVRGRNPRLIADGLALITGEIPRVTSFEGGYPLHRVYKDGSWQPDPWIWDDCALVIRLKNKGLVVISGCAHSGIINTLLYARRISGLNSVYAVIGGFHLSGKDCEPRIEQTVKELLKIKPEIVVPCHCTGWRGSYAIARAMPHAFIHNSVGNLYSF